ncbi:hypothetical protein HYY71_00815 [Candidatus Woesearchaeota archaeon]|nr:hypothetical protein [Candidatus Woesearchaeota archaeon]
MIYRFAIKTKSGSVYYIEDHSHMFEHQTWYIYINNKPQFIIGMWKNGFVHIYDIGAIEQFVGGQVLYNNTIIHKEHVISPDPRTIYAKTGEVVEIIRFK